MTPARYAVLRAGSLFSAPLKGSPMFCRRLFLVFLLLPGGSSLLRLEAAVFKTTKQATHESQLFNPFKTSCLLSAGGRDVGVKPVGTNRTACAHTR